LQEKAYETLLDLRAMESEYLASKAGLEEKEEGLQVALKDHLGRFQVRSEGGREGGREERREGGGEDRWDYHWSSMMVVFLFLSKNQTLIPPSLPPSLLPSLLPPNPQVNEEARALFIKQQLQRVGVARLAMVERLEKTLEALSEAVEGIDATADLAVYTQQVLALSPSLPSSSSSVEVVDDGGVALKHRVAPGMEHVEKCIKTLRALCHAFSALAAVEEVRKGRRKGGREGGVWCCRLSFSV
jgi:hypothetical protein